MYLISDPILLQLKEAYVSLMGKDDRHMKSLFKSSLGKLALILYEVGWEPRGRSN